MTHTQTNKHYNVRALSHKVKRGCSVQRMTSLNNWAAKNKEDYKQSDCSKNKDEYKQTGLHSHCSVGTH